MSFIVFHCAAVYKLNNKKTTSIDLLNNTNNANINNNNNNPWDNVSQCHSKHLITISMRLKHVLTHKKHLTKYIKTMTMNHTHTFNKDVNYTLYNTVLSKNIRSSH